MMIKIKNILLLALTDLVAFQGVMTSTSTDCYWPGEPSSDYDMQYGANPATLSAFPYMAAQWLPYGTYIKIQDYNNNDVVSKMICIDGQTWGGPNVLQTPASGATTCSWPSAVSAASYQRSNDNGATWTDIGPILAGATIGSEIWIRLTCSNGVYQQSICLSGIWSPAPNCSVPVAYPAIYGLWPFTNRTAYTDITLNGNNLLPHGSATIASSTVGPTGLLASSAQIGNASSSGYLSLASNADFSGSYWTVAFWAQYMSATDSGPIIHIPHQTTPQVFFTIRLNNQQIVIDLPSGASFSFPCGSAGSWHFYVISYKATLLYAFCDGSDATISPTVAANGTMPSQYGTTEMAVGFASMPVATTLNILMSGLIYAKKAFIDKACASLLQTQIAKAIAHQPITSKLALCNDLAGQCQTSQEFGLSLNIGTNLPPTSNWVLRGAARIGEYGLAIQLVPPMASHHGIVWNNKLSLAANSHWRAEISFQGATSQGVYAIFFMSNLDTEANGLLPFNINASSFVGLAIYFDLENGKLQIVASDSPATSQSWTFANMMNQGDSYNLASNACPQEVIIEKITDSLRITTSSTTGSSDYVPAKSAAFSRLVNSSAQLKMGIGAFTRSTIISQSNPPEVIAANVYTLIDLSTTTSTTTSTSTTTTSTTSTTTSTTSTTSTLAPTTTSEGTTTQALPSSSSSTVTSSQPTSSIATATTKTTLKTTTKTSQPVYVAEARATLRYQGNIVLPSGKIVSSTGAWDPDLNNPTSQTYQDACAVLIKGISQLYDGFDCTVTMKSISRGSIVSDYVVALRSLTQLTEDQIKQKVQEKLATLKAGGSSASGGILNWNSVQNVTLNKLTPISGPQQKNSAANTSALTFQTGGLAIIVLIMIGYSHLIC